MKWEYYVATFSPMIDNETRDRLNYLGSQGWELISATFAPDVEDPYLRRAIFKRLLPN